MLKVKSERIDIFKQLYPFMEPEIRLYIALAGLKVVSLLLAMLSPLLYLLLVNDVMIDGKLGMLLWVIVGNLAIYFLQTLVNVYNKILYNMIFIKVNMRVKKRLITIYGKMDAADYEKYDLGDFKNRIDNDVGMFEKFFTVHCIEYVNAFISIIVISVILLHMNWMLALFGFVMVPLSFWFAKFMSKKAKEISSEYREKYGKFEGFIHSSIQNWKEIKANNLEENKENALKQHWDVISKLFVRNQIYWYMNRAFVTLKDFFITKMNLYFVGGLLIIKGKLKVATLLVFMNYYEQFFNNIFTMTNLIIGLQNDKPSIERVLEILDYKTQEKRQVSELSDDIKINNLSFHYQGSEESALKNIALDICAGEHVAIAGRSGCGKSTLTKLILGIYEPSEGSVLLGGYNVREIILKNKIGVIMQEPMFFNFSIRKNLLLAKRDVTEEKINLACKHADIFDFIQSLPEKYDTIIGERGLKLSGGQRQRLAIARAILFDPNIIIFDEVTSSLDNESEKAIRNSIKYLSQCKTVITIAHRLSSILDADRVIVMDEGNVVAMGTHEKLYRNNKFYDLLFQKQYLVE